MVCIEDHSEVYNQIVEDEMESLELGLGSETSSVDDSGEWSTTSNEEYDSETQHPRDWEYRECFEQGIVILWTK